MEYWHSAYYSILTRREQSGMDGGGGIPTKEEKQLPLFFLLFHPTIYSHHTYYKLLLSLSLFYPTIPIFLFSRFLFFSGPLVLPLLLTQFTPIPSSKRNPFFILSSTTTTIIPPIPFKSRRQTEKRGILKKKDVACFSSLVSSVFSSPYLRTDVRTKRRKACIVSSDPLFYFLQTDNVV